MRDIVLYELGEEIDLQAPGTSGELILRAILSRKTRRGELVCRKHGGALYLQNRRGAITACHWPSTGAGDHPVALMSEEHRVQVEYIARAAVKEGLPADRELTLPSHVRPDLVVNGTCVTGTPPCGRPARLYPAGWRCDEHRPATTYPGVR